MWLYCATVLLHSLLFVGKTLNLSAPEMPCALGCKQCRIAKSVNNSAGHIDLNVDSIDIKVSLVISYCDEINTLVAVSILGIRLISPTSLQLLAKSV